MRILDKSVEELDRILGDDIAGDEKSRKYCQNCQRQYDDAQASLNGFSLLGLFFLLLWTS